MTAVEAGEGESGGVLFKSKGSTNSLQQVKAKKSRKNLKNKVEVTYGMTDMPWNTSATKGFSSM